MEIKVNGNLIKEYLTLGDVVVLNCDDDIVTALVSNVWGRECPYCLINIVNGSVWSSAKTIDKLYDDVKDKYPFENYSYIIYSSTEYFLQLNKK